MSRVFYEGITSTDEQRPVRWPETKLSSANIQAVTKSAPVLMSAVGNTLDDEQTSGSDAFGDVKPVGGTLKRAFDIAVSATALLLLAPVMLAVSALVWLTTGGPVIFAQDRIGYGGRIFRCYKFRSMCVDADERLARYLAENPDANEEWQQAQKLARDPRITWFGNLIRKSSLDELPQLWNVLRGDMSCIGPRPIVPQETNKYGDYKFDYFRARPGITGIWQVSGRSRVSYKKRIALDRLYTRRWSFAWDLAIIVMTIPAIMDFRSTS